MLDFTHFWRLLSLHSSSVGASADSTVNGTTNNPITNIPDNSTFNIPEGFPFSREPSPAPTPAPAPAPEATPSRKPVSQAQEKINMARNAITPRNQKSSRLEDTLLTITSQHLEHSKEESIRKLAQEDKKLRLETMTTFEKRRDGIMRRFDIKMLTAERCHELLEEVDREEEAMLATLRA
ncbi:hypothetical protein FB446DRAFT_795825 [Lentinula raphanica]|nr:hypothetical protein FB446DRAFT_795825 [Lentinula raphanica]